MAKSGIYINKGARFDNLHGNKEFGDQEIRAAYTHAAFISLGLVTIKGNEYSVTGRAVEKKTAENVAGRAVSHWVSKGYLLKGANGVTMSREGAQVLSSRLNGTSLSYRTSRGAIRLVCSLMRTGGKNNIGYVPVMV